MKKQPIPNFGKPTGFNAKLKTRIMTEAEIQKVKDEATRRAVEIMESRYDVEAIKVEGYNEAIEIAEEYYVLCGARVLYEVFGFRTKRIEKFLTALSDMMVDTQDGTHSIKELEKWLDEKVGLKLVRSSIEDELEKRQEAKNGGN